MIEELLEKEYRVIDILPEQVPAGSPGQYFAVEKYFLGKPALAEIHRRFTRLLLKLNCYSDFQVGTAGRLDQRGTEGPLYPAARGRRPDYAEP